MIIEVLTTELSLQKYNTTTLHITQLMREVPSNITITDEPYLERIKSRIAYADEICSRTQREDALAAITISAIQSTRETLNKERAAKEGRQISADDYQEPIARHAFILRQFKRPKEIALFRQVYGKLFFQISAYSSPAERELLLKKKIKESNFGSLEDSDAKCQAIELMAQDYLEDNIPYGQQIRETFPLGDVFVDGVNRKNCETMIKRFVNLIFGDNSLTPNHHEYGMYLAKSASLRSGDLSRQVGAAIFRTTGELATLGCNEVPKYGGGTYWSDGADDRRDFALGEDPNERIKREILHDLVGILFKQNGLAEPLNKLALLWQNLFAPVFFKDLFSAVWAPLRRRPKDEIDDGVAYGGHGWLRRRSVDSFFSAPRVRGDDAAGRRRQSLSSGRGDEDPAMIVPRSDQVRAPPSTADAPAHKSIWL